VRELETLEGLVRVAGDLLAFRKRPTFMAVKKRRTEIDRQRKGRVEKLSRDQLISRLAYYWDQLTPDLRRKSFRFSKKALFVYSKWSELTEQERDIIINAARICGTWGRG